MIRIIGVAMLWLIHSTHILGSVGLPMQGKEVAYIDKLYSYAQFFIFENVSNAQQHRVSSVCL